MSMRRLYAGGASFATNATKTEWPASVDTQYAAFFGNGTLNPKDNLNLGTSGAFSNIGTGPILQANYATFTRDLAALRTGFIDNVEQTWGMWVCRLPATATAVTGQCPIGGNWNTNGWHIDFTNGFPQFVASVQGYAGVAALNFTGIPISQWRCLAVVAPAVGGFGSMYDLTYGLSTTATVARVLVGGSGAAWTIGHTDFAEGATYQNPCDITFAAAGKGNPALATLQQMKASVKATLARRAVLIN